MSKKESKNQPGSLLIKVVIIFCFVAIIVTGITILFNNENNETEANDVTDSTLQINDQYSEEASNIDNDDNVIVNDQKTDALVVRSKLGNYLANNNGKYPDSVMFSDFINNYIGSDSLLVYTNDKIKYTDKVAQLPASDELLIGYGLGCNVSSDSLVDASSRNFAVMYINHKTSLPVCI